MSGPGGSSIKQIFACAAGRSDASLQATFFEVIMKKSIFKSKKFYGIFIVVLVLIFATLVSIFIGVPLLNFASEPKKFRITITELGLYGRLAYIGMLLIQIIFALVPGEPFEILAGYTFGAFEGTLLCILASVVGSSIVFFLARKFGRKFVNLFFSDEKINSLKILQSKKKINYLVFILFFIPGTPKDLLSYVAGLTPIKFLPYIIISTLAKFPSIITSTMGGNALGEKNYYFALVVFLITALICLIGLFIYNKITKK